MTKSEIFLNEDFNIVPAEKAVYRVVTEEEGSNFTETFHLVASRKRK